MPFRNRRRVRNSLAAILLLGLVAWVVPSYFSAERYRRRLQIGLEQALHRPVRFGAVSFRLLPRPGFSIQNVEVGDDPAFGAEPFARVDEIQCDLRWHSFWRSRMDFAHLHLDHPSFNVVMNPRGEWNVEKLLLESGVTAPDGVAANGGSPPQATQLDMDVEGARIDFLSGTTKKAFALTDVRARLQVNPRERRVQFQITASPMRPDLTIPTPGPVDAEGTWTPGADLRGPLQAHLRTRGALLYDWIPVVSGKNPEVYGVIDSDVRISGALPDLHVTGQANVTQLQRWEELPPSDSFPLGLNFNMRVVRGNHSVQVESFDVSFADSHLRLSGSVDNLTSVPQLDGVVSLSRSRLEDVGALVRHLWPAAGNWSLKGRLDAMLAVKGSWNDRRYGGFVGVTQASLETPSGSFPVSDIAVRINNRGASLAPVQVAVAPRVAIAAQGAIVRTKHGPQYEALLAAKGVPLHYALAFARGLGARLIQGIDATGSMTAALHLSGSSWPPARPLLSGRAELRAARLLVPGLTEPLNLPHASLQLNGNQILVDHLVAVLGTSVFSARMTHRGARANPWNFDLRANQLSLDQSALWFDSLGLRRPVPLLERLPGLSSFAARRDAASQIFASLHARGRFSTPLLRYRTVTLNNFSGVFEVRDRKIRMSAATFRSAGGRGSATGEVDLTSPHPLISARGSLADFPLQSLTARLPGPAGQLRGTVSATGTFETRGLVREELARNLTGQIKLNVRDLSFGDFDPLEALVKQAHWGTLDPARGPAPSSRLTMNVETRDGRFILKDTPVEISGARLQCNGEYDWTGAVDLVVRANLGLLRRRWLAGDDAPHASPASIEIHLGGPVDHLAVITPESAATASTRQRGQIR